MTSTINSNGLTARTFLFGNGSEHETVALRRSFAEHGVTGAYGREFKNLNHAAQEAAGDAFSSVTASLLDVDLGVMAVAGWRIHQRLVNAAKETLRVPGREEVVQLGTHQITSTHRPTVDLLVDGVHAHTFRFRLTIVVDVELAAAVIRAGELVALNVGDTSITGTLTLEAARGDIELIHQQRQVDLNRIIRLNNGVPLISAN